MQKCQYGANADGCHKGFFCYPADKCCEIHRNRLVEQGQQFLPKLREDCQKPTNMDCTELIGGPYKECPIGVDNEGCLKGTSCVPEDSCCPPLELPPAELTWGGYLKHA